MTSTDPGGPRVAGEPAADRLMRSLDYRLHPHARRLTRDEVVVVLRALADHTAIQEALRHPIEPGSPWPQATSVGRWLHAVGDQLERSLHPGDHRGIDPVCGRLWADHPGPKDGAPYLCASSGGAFQSIPIDPPLTINAGDLVVHEHDPTTGRLNTITNTTTGESRELGKPRDA